MNYREQMDEMLAALPGEGARKRLLLHACCAPCSSACLELLSVFLDVTVLFYNPNITEEAEYTHRLAEEKRLIAAYNEAIAKGFKPDCSGEASSETRTPIAILESRYDPETFLEAARGLEDAPEGGERCRKCFAIRLDEAARIAKDGAFDFFTTTLTLSPRKNADVLNEVGQEAAERYGVPFLPSDFKKKDGYLRSLQLSRAHDLYRQDYCGCVFSKAERACAKCRAC